MTRINIEYCENVSWTVENKNYCSLCSRLNFLLLYQQVNSHWLLMKLLTHTSFYSVLLAGTA